MTYIRLPTRVIATVYVCNMMTPRHYSYILKLRLKDRVERGIHLRVVDLGIRREVLNNVKILMPVCNLSTRFENESRILNRYIR